MIAERRIRTLALSAPEEGWIGRGAFLVEDALRTASLPWADAGRLLLVRAVDLGVIPADAAPATVALQLEHRLRELTPTAVHAAHPTAPRAAAVWFQDAAEACARLAVLLARGEEPTAWFWPLAVPTWTPGTPRATALRALLLAALATPAGPAAALELVRALEEAGRLDLLAAALMEADGPVLLRAFGWRMPEMVLEGSRPEIREGEAVPARWAAVWGRGDARRVWLERAVGAVAKTIPGGEGERPVAGGAPFESPGPSESRLRRDPHPLAPSPTRTHARPGEGEPDGPLPLWSGSLGGGAPLPGGGSACGRGDGGEGLWEGEPPVPHEDHPEAVEPVQETPPAPPSAHAGLFFLLPALARLGLATFLADHPDLEDARFAARLLDHLAERLGAPADDPLRRVLDLPEEDAIAAENLQIHLTTWRLAVRRWCRRRAGIGLASLVRRPGRVLASRTHVDLYFDPQQVDIRVRRAGLDFDPGWVAWLGRVVQFHYALPPEVSDVR